MSQERYDTESVYNVTNTRTPHSVFKEWWGDELGDPIAQFEGSKSQGCSSRPVSCRGQYTECVLAMASSRRFLVAAALLAIAAIVHTARASTVLGEFMSLSSLLT